MWPNSTNSGKAAFLGSFDLACILAQLRRNPRQADRLVHARLGSARDFEIVFHAEQSVLAELQPHPHGASADRDVVILAPGEILHGRAEGVGRQRAHVHLQALVPDFRAGFVGALCQHLSHARIGQEAFERGGGLRPRHQQIQIAHRLASPPQTAGRSDHIDAGHLPQILDQFGSHGLGVTEQIAAATLAISRDRPQHLLFELSAHARQPAELLLLAELLQFIDGADVKMFEDQRDALRTQSLNLQEFKRAWLETSLVTHRVSRTTLAPRFRSVPVRVPCQSRGRP